MSGAEASDQKKQGKATEVKKPEDNRRDVAQETVEVQGESESDKLKSKVYTATRDTLFLKDATHTRTHALSLDWVLGANSALPVFSLQDQNQLVVFYAGAHVGIIYNHTSNSQHILQGHSSAISCTCVSEDNRWIATADRALKSTVMIWDSYSGIPVHTLFDCHPEGGVGAMAFSRDTQQLVTLGTGGAQRVCIWDWTNETEEPLFSTELSPDAGSQVYIVFNPNDSTQLLSNSEGQVLFYSTAEGSLQYFPLNLERVGNKPFNQSVFHWKESQVLTATAAGTIVVWELMEDLAANRNLRSDRIRFVPLQESSITVLTVADSCIVTGDARGHVKFYDENFLLLTFYDQLGLDAVVSISFSKECAEGTQEDCAVEAAPLIIRNFVVSTASSKVVHVDAQTGDHQILLHENCEPLHALACHPSRPAVVMGNHAGVLKVWDYESKKTTCSVTFATEKQIECLTFDPQGSYLALGFGSGAVHILDPDTLESDPKARFSKTKDSITHICFSPDSTYLATADAGQTVTVFRLQTAEGSPPRWEYLGRQQSHYMPIKDLLFGAQADSTRPRLLSLSMDRHLVEYDLGSNAVDQLGILSSERAEQSAVPMCMTWYPPLTTEPFLLIASDQYKMKLLNGITKMCRKTLLGPMYGSPVKRTVVLPVPEGSKTSSYYMAFITEDMVGLQILPLDGNPYKSNALICHPTGASTLDCSYDGRFVFTAGGSDCTVLSWEISLNALEAAAALGGKDLAPFYTLLEGGRDGKFFREIEDYFYYCQIRHQGIEVIETRPVSTTIPLTEVPSLMRALAFFPSEKEIEDMQNEVKFSNSAETEEHVTDITLEEFIKLYINHRPAFGISSDELSKAFQVLCDCDGTGQLALRRQDLLEVLQVRGESMTEDEVAECFTALLGFREEKEEESSELSICKSDNGDGEYSLENVIPDDISMEIFASHILGFSSAAEKSNESGNGSSLPT